MTLYYSTTILPPDGYTEPLNQWNSVVDEWTPEDLKSAEDWKQLWKDCGGHVYELSEESVGEDDEDLPELEAIVAEDNVLELLDEVPDRMFVVVYSWGIQYVGLEIFTEDMLEDRDEQP